MINRIHTFSDCLTQGRRTVTGIPAMRLFMRLLWITTRCGFFTVRAGLTGWLRLDAISPPFASASGSSAFNGDLLCSGQELSFRADKPGFHSFGNTASVIAG